MLLDFDRLGFLRYVLGGIAILVGAFLLLPILLIVALSFGSSRYLQFPPAAWTTKWYAQLFSDPDWLSAFGTSLEIAIVRSYCGDLDRLDGVLCAYSGALSGQRGGTRAPSHSNGASRSYLGRRTLRVLSPGSS